MKIYLLTKSYIPANRHKTSFIGPRWGWDIFSWVWTCNAQCLFSGNECQLIKIFLLKFSLKNIKIRHKTKIKLWLNDYDILISDPNSTICIFENWERFYWSTKPDAGKLGLGRRATEKDVRPLQGKYKYQKDFRLCNWLESISKLN